MSLLNDKCAERIAAGRASGDHLVKLFETLAADAELHEESVADLAVYYLKPDDEFVVGKYVPELHLVVRRVEPDDVEETNEH
jgi:hypothetical protein